VAHLNQEQRLLVDDFYEETPWEVGLKHYLRGDSGLNMTLKIMPLRNDAPIYISAERRPTFSEEKEIANVRAIQVSPYEVRMELRNGKGP
jgi:hypothetical protein